MYNIRDHGAHGDGRTLDTGAIQKTIEACAAAGGGQVLFPPGRYLSGTVHLKSNVTLRLEEGARLIGSPDLALYQSFTPPAGAFEARFRNWHRALVLGVGVENAGIAGAGIIDGNRVVDPQGEEKIRGPHAILLGRSRGIHIHGVSIVDAANYAILLEWTDQVEVRDVQVTGGWDGVHFRASADQPCRDIRIGGCAFHTGDDAIAGRYVRNLVVDDCVINSSCNGVRIIGPVSDMQLRNCRFFGPGKHRQPTSKRKNMLAGIILQPGAWDPCDGALEDVLISDVTMNNVASPFAVWLKRPGNTAERITIERLTASGVYRTAASVESWTARPVGQVVLRDLDLQYAGRVRPRGRHTDGKPGVDVHELPAWGLYARHVQQLQLERVRLRCVPDDRRPALIGEGITQLTCDGVRLPAVPGAAEPVVLKNVQHVEVRDSDFAAGPRR